jgi:predicted CoA-binding protein
MFASEAITQLTNRAEEILDESKTIAIVGLSRNRHKDSQFVARYLQNAGYTVVPVNPTADEILGEKAFPNLTEIPFNVDSVVVFLPPKIIPGFIDQAFDIKPKGIWLQLGTGEQPEAVQKAQEKSITLFENRCVKVDHQFLIRPKKKSTH